MLANKLEVIVYRNAGYSWHSQVINEPMWEQIENAIRDLDRAEYPFLYIYLPDGRGASNVWMLNVIGGRASMAFREQTKVGTSMAFPRPQPT